MSTSAGLTDAAIAAGSDGPPEAFEVEPDGPRPSEPLDPPDLPGATLAGSVPDPWLVAPWPNPFCGGVGRGRSGRDDLRRRPELVVDRSACGAGGEDEENHGDAR